MKGFRFLKCILFYFYTAVIYGISIEDPHRITWNPCRLTIGTQGYHPNEIVQVKRCKPFILLHVYFGNCLELQFLERWLLLGSNLGNTLFKAYLFHRLQV